MPTEDVHNSVMRACQALLAPGQVTELRAINVYGKKGFTAAGWFDDFEALAAAAARYETKDAEGLYLIANPLHDACLARSNNRMLERPAHASSDRDVVNRQMLLVDIDPVRPAGVSSDDAELEAARGVASAVIAELEGGHGWPKAVRAFSGNGVHLLYRVDLPNDEDAKELCRACLATLSERFSTDRVHVDESVFNAARLIKLHGTTARKGVSTPARPHRRSHVWPSQGAYPLFGALGVVERRQLEALAGCAAQPKKSALTRKAAATRVQPDKSGFFFDIEAFIAKHKIAVRSTEPWDGGVRYVLQHCVFDPSHDRTSATLGRTKTGALYYKCQHDSCVNRTWRDVRAHFGEPGARKTRQEGKQTKDEADPWTLAQSLLDEEWTDPDTGEVRVRRHRQQFYEYHARRHRYRPLSEDAVRTRVTRWLGDRVDRVTRRLSGDVLQSMEALTTVDEEAEMPFMCCVDPQANVSRVDPRRRRLVSLKNGVLDLDAVVAGRPFGECLRPHTANWLSTVALPFAFPTTEAEAACERWLLFLEEIFEGDQERLRLLQEIFGYCLLDDNRFERFFVFCGSGRNGKSTVLKVLTALLSDQCVSALTPKQITDPQMVYEMYGKLANICGDMPRLDSVEEGVLKAIVSGDRVTSNRKYKDPLSFQPTAKLLFATNELPTFADRSLGIWRRMALVSFNYTVPVERIDVRLLNKLEDEMSGVLLWSLEGLCRLLAAGEFTHSGVCDQATREYRIGCFPVLTFLEECTEDGGEVELGYLWNKYRAWASACGFKYRKGLKGFEADIKSFRPTVTTEKSSGRISLERKLRGLQLRFGLDFSMLR